MRATARGAVAAMASLGAMIASIVQPGRVEACTCSPATALAPANGATGVPTNLSELLINGVFEDSVVTLRSATATIPLGPAIPTETNASSVYLMRYPVLAALEPGTAYAIYIDGDVPWSPASFTTGAGADTAAPPAIVFESLRLARLDILGQPGSCGGVITRIEAMLSGVDEAAVIETSMRGPTGTQEFVLPYPYGLYMLGSEFCTIPATIQKDAMYCISVRARDLGGNVGPASERCAVTRACADVENWPDVPEGDIQDCPRPGDEPLDGDPDGDGADTGGCAATGAGSGPAAGLVVLALLAVARRRGRAAPTARR